jgi:tetratricopeptide (TPR) repeat protein
MAASGLSVRAQKPADQPIVYHKIEGRLRIHNAAATNLRVRLVREDQHRPIGETFTRSRGEFEFPNVPEGEYLVETLESNELEATSTRVLVRPFPRERSAVVHVEIEIPEKSPDPVRSGVIAADVDLNVPKEAVTRYHNGIKAIGNGDQQRALKEFQSAITIFPEYYAARLELGRELRFEKRFGEAEEVLRPLTEIAPKHAEAWIENGIVLLELKRRDEAAEKLQIAVQREETSWAAHLYLGWALLEEHAAEATPHFERALELDEQKSARAHLALARLAEAKGQRQLAIRHLETYLRLAPDASDAEMTRRLLDNLRKPNP